MSLPLCPVLEYPYFYGTRWSNSGLSFEEQVDLGAQIREYHESCPVIGLKPGFGVAPDGRHQHDLIMGGKRGAAVLTLAELMSIASCVNAANQPNMVYICPWVLA